MNLFNRRPLALASVCFLIFSVVCVCLTETPKLVLLISAALAALVFFVLTRKRHRFAYIGFVICLLLILSLGNSLFAIDRHFRTASRYDGQTVPTEAEIVEVFYRRDRFGIYQIKTHTLDNKRASLSLTCSLSCEEPLDVGDTFTATVSISASSDARRLSLLSEIGQGGFGGADADHVVRTGRRNTPRALASRLNQKLCAALSLHYDSDAAGLLSAMLLGNRASLSSATTYHFRRAGVSHLLALSGMHISVLAFAVMRLTALFPLSKRMRSLLLLLFLALFSVLTGLSASILRAAIMTAFVQCAGLLRRDNDPFTSLPFAAALIVAVNGIAVLDIGLWLSVFATLGILLVSTFTKSLTQKKNPVIRCMARTLFLPILFSLAATLLTLPLTSFVFGQFSVIGIPANLVFPPLMTLFLYLSLLSVPLPFLRGLINAAATGYLRLLSHFASCPSALLPFGQVTVRVLLILVALLLFVWIAFRWKHPRVIFIPIAACLLAIISITLAEQIRIANDTSFTYITPTTESEEEYLLLHDGGSTVLCDLSPGTGRGFRDCLSPALDAIGENDIDLLYISHYHDGLTAILPYLSGKYLIRSVIAPIPRTTYEERLWKALSRSCKELEIPLSQEDASRRSAVGRIVVEGLPRTAADSGNDEADTALYLSLGDEGVVYTSADYTDTPAYKELLSPMHNRADVIVLGKHGRSKSGEIAPRYPLDSRIKTILICDPARGILVAPEDEKRMTNIRFLKAPLCFRYPS